MKKTSKATALLLSGALTLSATACAARATIQTGDGSSSTAPSTSTSDAAATTAPTATPVEAASTSGLPEASAANTTPSAETASWPQWRGPNRDGSVVGVAPPKTWPKSLKDEWKVMVGVGHASPVVSEGRVFVFARQGEDEVLMCLDAATGKEVWRSANPSVAYEMNPAARGHGKGPKSTPVVSGGRVFTLGITGVLSAHDAKTGKVVWRKNFSGQYPNTSPLYGTSMSPLVEDGLVIAHVGGHDKGALTAFEAATGKVKWSFEPDGPGYSSPVVFRTGGERQIVTFTQKELVAVSAANGIIRWKLPAKSSYDTNSVTPFVYKDTIIFSLEEKGTMAVRPVKQGSGFTAQEVWRNDEAELYMNSPVAEGNLLFGMSARKKGQFFCLDADTGKTVWMGPGRAGENAAILNLAGTLLLLTNDAKLIVLPASAKEYAPLAEYTVANSPTWAHPVVVSGTRILVKDETNLISLSIPAN